MAEVEIWQPGKKLYGGRYTILKATRDRIELGSGGFGITYLARDFQGKKVVIKTLNAKAQASEDFSKIQQSFRDEATRLGYCQHPYIVPIENKFDVGHLPCIVMEYIKGETLWDYVQKNGALSESEALLYIHQIGEALTHIHAKGLLHRDVNPHNIILRSDKSEVILIDFGISKEFIPDVTQRYTVAYTRCFAPLEQSDPNGKLGEYTDVYSLAATLYYLLTGKEPSPAPNRAIRDELIPPQQHNPKISDNVNYAIFNGMKLDAKNRDRSIKDWLMLLESLNRWQVNNKYQLLRILFNSNLKRFATFLVVVIVLCIGLINIIIYNKLSTSSTSFKCMKKDEGWAIFFEDDQNTLSSSPVINLGYIKTSSGLTPQQRCRIASQRLTKLITNNTKRLESLYLTSGVVNTQYVLCVITPEKGLCQDDNIIFTLDGINSEQDKLDAPVNLETFIAKSYRDNNTDGYTKSIAVKKLFSLPPPPRSGIPAGRRVGRDPF